MILEFKEQFRLPAAKVYSYFETPADWARVFGLKGTSKNLGDGWYEVPLKNFPFPLVARNTEQELGKMVRWVFRGFWKGRGEVRFVETPDGVLVEGFEEVAARPLLFLSPLVERLVLERGFRAVWKIGWHRMRKMEADGGDS